MGVVDEWEGCQCGVNANGGWFGQEGVLRECTRMIARRPGRGLRGFG